MRKRPRQRETLLLSAGKPRAQLPQAILHLVPEGRPAQGLLHPVIQLRAIPESGAPCRERHVVIDGKR